MGKIILIWTASYNMARKTTIVNDGIAIYVCQV